MSSLTLHLRRHNTCERPTSHPIFCHAMLANDMLTYMYVQQKTASLGWPYTVMLRAMLHMQYCTIVLASFII